MHSHAIKATMASKIRHPYPRPQLSRCRPFVVMDKFRTAPCEDLPTAHFAAKCHCFFRMSNCAFLVLPRHKTAMNHLIGSVILPVKYVEDKLTFNAQPNQLAQQGCERRTPSHSIHTADELQIRNDPRTSSRRNNHLSFVLWHPIDWSQALHIFPLSPDVRRSNLRSWWYGKRSDLSPMLLLLPY